jgi:hypothetical protein
MTFDNQLMAFKCQSVIFSFSRTEIFSTEIESDWISVEKPGGVLEVLEAAGGKLRVAQGPRSRRESGI